MYVTRRVRSVDAAHKAKRARKCCMHAMMRTVLWNQKQSEVPAEHTFIQNTMSFKQIAAEQLSHQQQLIYLIFR